MKKEIIDLLIDHIENGVYYIRPQSVLDAISEFVETSKKDIAECVCYDINTGEFVTNDFLDAMDYTNGITYSPEINQIILITPIEGSKRRMKKIINAFK